MSDGFGIAREDADAPALSLECGEKFWRAGLRGCLVGDLDLDVGELLLLLGQVGGSESVKSLEDGFVGRQAKAAADSREVVEAFGEGAVHVKDPGGALGDRWVNRWMQRRGEGHELVRSLSYYRCASTL